MTMERKTTRDARRPRPLPARHRGDDLDAIAAFLLVLGRDFRVLEPRALRQRLARLSRRLAEAAGPAEA
jgi:predicted DNA-binding transcriptional regulator YafY